MNKLDFGSSFHLHEGWTSVDKENVGQEVVADILEGLPFPDNHFDMAVTNHVLHMFTVPELVEKVLPELLRVLKPGAVLRVIDIDPLLAFSAYMRGDARALIIPDEVEPTLDGKFALYLTWYGTRRSLSTASFMCELMLRAGFKDSATAHFQSTFSLNTEIVELDSRPTESYFVEGIK